MSPASSPSAPPRTDPLDDGQLLTDEDMRRLFKRDRVTLFRWRRDLNLPHYVMGQTIRYHRSEVAAWLEKHRGAVKSVKSARRRAK